MLPNTTSKARRRLKLLDIQLDRTTGLKHLPKANDVTPNDTRAKARQPSKVIIIKS